MPRTRSGWKQYERRVIALLGGRRIPVTGRSGPGGDPGDGELPGYYVEVRDRARARPIRWFREVAQEAREAGGTPVLIFKGPTPALSPLVLMRLRDFEEVYRGARPGSGAGGGPRGEGDVAAARGIPGGRQRPGVRGLPAAPASGPDVAGSHDG